MRVLHSIADLQEINKKIVYALGTFDGLHKGHQSVISRAVDLAKKEGAVSVLFTFDKHPLAVLAPDRVPKTVLERQDMASFVEDLGVDYIFEYPVSQETLGLSAEAFLESLTDSLEVKGFVMGDNFTFGDKGLGNPAFLQAWAQARNITVKVEPLLCDASKHVISSTMIRQAVQEGRMEEALHMLGRPFQFKGQVIKGDQRGRTLGFPTLNLRIPDTLVVPPDGVYVNRVKIRGQWYGGVGNVGDNPTFTNQYHRCEVHVFDFKQDIYGDMVTVEFLHYIRGEVKFHSLDDLIEQMKQDETIARHILAEYK